jgi:hypothetical protein
MYKFIFGLILLLVFLSCRKEEIAKTNKSDADTIQSVAPNIFNVHLLKTTFSSATISWDAAVDSNNDVWYYTVLLNDSVFFDKIKTDTLLTIRNLKPFRTYNGKIVVTDRKNNKTSVLFQFMTNKYEIKFDNIYPIEYNRAEGNCIEKTNDGGYVIGGTVNFGTGNNTMILKIDSLGYEQWHKIYLNHSGSGVCIRQTSDNGYILTDQAKLLRLDDSGNEVWRYPIPGYGESNSLVITPDNNYLITSNVYDTISRTQKAEIIRFTDNNGILWRKRFGKSDITRANFIERINDGNYLILGTERKLEEKTDVQLTKVEESGNILWQKKFEKIGYEFVTQLTPTKDNGCIISGFSMGERDITEAMIIKVDQYGNQQWLSTFLWNYFKTIAYSVKQTDDGYLFCGGNGYTPEEAILVKLDNNGDLLWKKQYYPSYLDYIWRAHDMELTQDKGVIFVGVKSWVWTGDGKEVGLWVKRTNEQGE